MELKLGGWGQLVMSKILKVTSSSSKVKWVNIGMEIIRGQMIPYDLSFAC